MGNYGKVEIRGGDFLKIEAGKAHVIRLLDKAPHTFYKHWDQEKKTSSDCTGKENGCADCLSGNKPRQTWAANVYSHNDGKVLVFEWGASVMKLIRTIDNDLESQGINIADVDLSVSKTGAGMETKYAVVPRQKSQPIPADLELHEIDGELPF